jgi:glycolate oxidase
VKLPRLKGTVSDDPVLLERASLDMSRYRVRPRLVARPADEEDVVRLVAWAAGERTPLTARGAGSNLSGSAVGPGAIVLFDDLNRVLALSGAGATLQPGIRYDAVNRAAADQGLALRYDVSSGSFSTIGGNIAARAGGLRSVRYGSVARWVHGVRFVCPAHGVVDTREAAPPGLAAAVNALRADLLADDEAVAALRRRAALKTASGYNLRGLLDAATTQEMIAQLMVGSVGTLGILTEVELALVARPAAQRLAAAFFARLEDACALAPELVATGPSALELMDGEGTGLVLALPGAPTRGVAGAAAVLLVEHEEGTPGPLPRPEEARRILDSSALAIWEVPSTAAEAVWNVRWSMLTSIRRRHETVDRRFLSFVDDLAVPAAELVPFVGEVRRIFENEGVAAIIYGHAGEGNLHMRPLIERAGWRERVHRVADGCYEAALRRGGTLTAEHGSGRNRAPFLEREWGERLYGYFRRVKAIFDPEDLLNPEVMFSQRDFTAQLEF